MPTLVLPPKYSEDTVKLAQAAVRAGWGTRRLESWDVAEGTRIPEAALYGEPGFAETVARPLGVRLLEPALDTLARLPRKFVRRGVELSTLGDARRRKGRWLLRPAVSKVFPKRVYYDGAGLPGPRELPDVVPILICEVVEFEWEYRVFVADGKIASFSPWRRGSQLARQGDQWLFDPKRDADVQAVVSELLVEAMAALPPSAALDVGLLGGAWAVSEVSCPAEAGLLGCSEDQVLPAIARASGL